MKRLFYSSALLTALTMLCISSCKKDDNPFSFVDGYKAPLTEAKGVEHTGDYFPLTETYYWNYTGFESLVGEMTMNYQGEKETETLDDDYACSSTVRITTPETIKLNSGTYTLFPVHETARANYETSYATRYFEKSTDAIYIRAIQMDFGNIIEVSNPMYLKIPLVVGDRWEAHPEIDMESLMDDELDFAGDVDMDMKCVMYVIGKEDMSWKANMVETVRLDERAQAKAKINVKEDGVKGSMSFDIRITLNLNYLKEVGLIAQESEISLSMSGSLSGGGEKASFKMNMDSSGNYTLSTYSLNGKKSATQKSSSSEHELKNKLLEQTDNPTIQKQLEKGLRFVEIVKGVML